MGSLIMLLEGRYNRRLVLYFVWHALYSEQWVGQGGGATVAFEELLHIKIWSVDVCQVNWGGIWSDYFPVVRVKAVVYLDGTGGPKHMSAAQKLSLWAQAYVHQTTNYHWSWGGLGPRHPTPHTPPVQSECINMNSNTLSSGEQG